MGDGTRSDNYTVLARLGCLQSFSKLAIEDQNKLIPILIRLKPIVDKFSPKEINAHVITDWADIFACESDVDFQIILPKKLVILNRLSKKVNSGVVWSYIGFNFIIFLISIAAFNHVSLGSLNTNLGLEITDSIWNYIDVIGDWVTSIQEAAAGDIAVASVNLLTTCHFTICSILVNIAAHTDLVTMSAATASGLVGFSFAICMVICCFIELYEIKKCNERIAKLELHFAAKDNSPELKASLANAIELEHAKKADHIRNAKSWAGCGIAMTAVAIVIFLTLSGVTFGALPAATIAVAALAVVSGLIRKWWVEREPHVANLKAMKSHKEMYSGRDHGDTVTDKDRGDRDDEVINIILNDKVVPSQK